jgi:thymidylate synthase (FAD)
MKITDMKVELKRVDGTDLDVANAARVSFDKESQWDYIDPETGERLTAVWDGNEVTLFDDSGLRKILKNADMKLISYLAKHDHWTPFAHVGAQFRVKTSVFIARQLVKHQIGLVWNEVSRRYVDTSPEYMRLTWRWAAANVKQGSGGEMDAETSAKVDAVFWPAVERTDRAYAEMLALGVAPEQARAVLCLDHMTEWVWTGSLVAWARVCRLRLDPHAQGEVRDVAQRFDELLRPAFPVSWPALMGEHG